ncbi:molecular chaperone TorD family protein [Shewanella sp. A3A]|uniref:Molecular chaperone TorD family protein n=1 Tax=Shewanella electrica TaxID=515560 RepID=A0ABT2FLT7_9GAMM|nr:molecular chaperone TorD family protein [Shewanella electrica]MCH1919646.1 molecular chaperone TorD family protein [Shewanella ferrihydritica]MCH1925825.1 molecular chaperone TorD family protein [Shewanella electrica]MCS4557290.1 molecular chaperone TorD family protein [Shewanella electrica]
MTENTKQISENDLLRADIYQLLAALLRRTPSAELLQFLHGLEVDSNDDSSMTRAWLSMKLAAEQFSAEQLEDEYFNLFIGVGSGEILPYGSWFMTGSLMDKPLALLRQDLIQLGFERGDDVKEPEDHVAALFEVMSALILEAPSHQQLAFYRRHLGSWIIRFWDSLSRCNSAAFYAVVAQLGRAFFETEIVEFERLVLSTPVVESSGVQIQPKANELAS